MFGFFYDAPGNEQIYQRVKDEIAEPNPDGLILHMVSELDTGGLRHFNVWESKEQWERFQAERVGPALGRVLQGMGIVEPPARPTITEMDLIDVITNA